VSCEKIEGIYSEGLSNLEELNHIKPTLPEDATIVGTQSLVVSIGRAQSQAGVIIWVANSP